ncbi:MAG: hypothetical protein AAFN77_17045 [Planctomycetota bacterium]
MTKTNTDKKHTSGTSLRSGLKAIVIALGLILMAGCQSRPLFGPPGTMDVQRTRAMVHDPYPNQEIGPQIFGARPLGFEQPRTETNQLQSIAARRGGRYQPGGF